MLDKGTASTMDIMNYGSAPSVGGKGGPRKLLDFVTGIFGLFYRSWCHEECMKPLMERTLFVHHDCQ